MQFEYDPESLIEEVKKRPGIWDFDNVDYRTKSTRHKLWTEVVNALMSSDVKISKSERRELELQLQKKWKSMRDCFQKYISHPNRTKRPYIYSKHLAFLIKNQKEVPQTETGSSESEEGTSRKTSWRRRKKLKLARDSSDDNDIDKDDCRSNDGVTIEVPLKQPTYKPVIDEFAFASVDSQSRTEQEDPDKLFLLSLLPHLKSVPEEMRLNIKMDIMQVLRNANYQSQMGNKLREMYTTHNKFHVPADQYACRDDGRRDMPFHPKNS
ncbi:dorsal interacting protein 3 [Danaus plexippus plexippus]|uniref:Dorsal interacting protein 3 n=1 Tax=Danaus plexippus plexippus TaxID=278856 RepID=A0A212EWI2_DANPL|nr:dorsal interacting protein 3 [Danaus plexippus plexippus]